jgi:hypothetical protein
LDIDECKRASFLLQTKDTLMDQQGTEPLGLLRVVDKVQAQKKKTDKGRVLNMTDGKDEELQANRGRLTRAWAR